MYSFISVDSKRALRIFNATSVVFSIVMLFYSRVSQVAVIGIQVVYIMLSFLVLGGGN